MKADPKKLDRPELEKKYLELLNENHELKIFVMRLAAVTHCKFTSVGDLENIRQALDEIFAGAKVRRRKPIPDGPVMLRYDPRTVSTADLIALDDETDFMTARQRELVELLHARISHSEILTIYDVKSINAPLAQLLLKYFKIKDGIKKPRRGRDKKYKLKTEKTLPDKKTE